MVTARVLVVVLAAGCLRAAVAHAAPESPAAPTEGAGEVPGPEPGPQTPAAAPTEEAGEVPGEGPAAERAVGDDEARRDRARSLFASAVQAIRDQRWLEAEEQLRQSYALVPRASTLYNLALVLFESGRPKESFELASQLLASNPPISEEHRRNANRLIEHLERRLSRLHLQVTPPDAVLSIDDAALEGSGADRRLVLEPGPHQLRISRSGYESQSLKVDLHAGREHTVQVELATTDPVRDQAAPAPVSLDGGRAAPAARVPEPPVAPWVMVGAGGAVLGAALATGILAKAADNDFVEHCPTGEECDPGLRPLQQRVDRLATATDVLLAAGGATVVGGLVWWYLTKTRGRSGFRAAASVSPTAVQVGLESAF